MNTLRTVLATCVLAAASVVGAQPAMAATTATLYVIQGVNDASWTMSVDGEQVADQAPAKKIVGPMKLTPGDHVVTATNESGTEVEATVAVKPGQNWDVVLHRPVDPTADPLFTAFTNDLRAVAADSGRLSVAHTAVAPPADIRVDGDVLLSNVASTEQISTIVPAGVYPVDVVPTTKDGPSVLGPVDLKVEPGKLTRVFAIGNADEQTMDAVVQVLDVPTSKTAAPTDVPAGNGGQAAGLFSVDGRSPGLPLAGVLVMILGALLVVTGRRHARRVG